MRILRHACLTSLAVCSVQASAQQSISDPEVVFDLESERATRTDEPTGSLKSLVLRHRGVELQIERSLKTGFDLVDNRAGGQRKPASWGRISLDPFFAPDAVDTFVITFSEPVFSFSIEFGDFGGDPDIVTLTALSGKGATGSVVDFVATVWLGNLRRDEPGSISIDGPMRSVIVTGGGPDLANSLYWDNLRVTVPPRVGVALDTETPLDPGVVDVELALDRPMRSCAPDLTDDGAVDTNDFFAFLSLYGAGHPDADFTRDRRVDTNDFFAFLAAYQDGC